MADPGYDFFATGAGGTTVAQPGPAETEAPADATVSRFGGPPAVPAPAVPTPTLPPAPVPAAVATPPAAAAYPGYDPGPVNQFGTPVTLSSVPTGPYAAPGTGAAPIEQPGMLSTWSGPASGLDTTAPPPSSAPAPVMVSRFGSPITPDGLAVEGQGGYPPPAFSAGPDRSAPLPRPGVSTASTATPSGVHLAGIIGIIEGALLIAAGLLAFAGYLALKSQLDLLASTPGLSGSGLSLGAISGVILAGIVFVLGIGAGYVVAGVATLRGARWGAWTLLVVSALNLLYGAYELVSGAGGLSTFLAIALSGAVVVLLCRGESMRWLRRT